MNSQGIPSTALRNLTVLAWSIDHIGNDFWHEFIQEHRKGGRPISDDRTVTDEVRLGFGGAKLVWRGELGLISQCNEKHFELMTCKECVCESKMTR